MTDCLDCRLTVWLNWQTDWLVYWAIWLTGWLTGRMIDWTGWLTGGSTGWLNIILHRLTHCGHSMWKWAIWLMITCITCQWGYHGQFRYRISMLNSCMNETQLWDQCQTPEYYRCIACGFFNVDAMTVK